MELFKLSTTTILLSLMATLGLMVSLNTPRVLSLETGYTYNTGENLTMAELYRDLKCAYLNAGVTHMRLVKHILEDKTIPYSAAVGLMINYDIRAVICTLYGVDAVEIGSLWLLLLYASTVLPIYDKRIAKDTDEDRRAATIAGRKEVHDYVTDRMQRELSAARCRPGNRFSWYLERYEQQIATMPSSQHKLCYIQTVGFRNCKDLDTLLRTNDAGSTYGMRYGAMWPRHLFVNNLGANKSLKLTLMTAYDVRISWGRASEVLENDYENAFMMKSRTVNFLPLLSIKMYYNGVFALLKGIMGRLLWKCLLHANWFQRREEHLTNCLYFLIEFQQLLHLHDDPDVLDLLNRLSTSVVIVDDVINQIRHQLHNVNVILQCEATNELTLEPEQLPSNVNQGTSSHLNDIVGTARAFIEDLTFAFEMVDFDIIRSIMTYANTNYMLTNDIV